jgi:hypothetical protein
VVVARLSESIVAPIDNAANRPARCGDSLVTIRAVRKVRPANKVTIEAVTPDGEPKTRDSGAPVIEIELAIRSAGGSTNPLSPDNLSEEQFEIIDGAGRVWTPSPCWLSDSHPKRRDTELIVRLAPVDPDMAPWRGEIKGAKMRYHEMTVAKIDVPFEFTDLVLP